jgi:hypothetical protein
VNEVRVSAFSSLSLAPDFSPVSAAGMTRSRFNGFCLGRRLKAVETAFAYSFGFHPAEAGC